MTDQEKIIKGVNYTCDLAKVTLGAEGRLVAIDHPLFPTFTKDGYSVIKSVNLSDTAENMGNLLMRECATKTVDQAKDNTTTSVVLAQAIINGAKILIDNGFSHVELREGIKLAEKDIIAELKNLSKDVSKDDIYEIAKTSANGDDNIAKLIQEAYNNITKEGVIEIEETKQTESSLEIVDGFKFDKGIISHHLFTDKDRQISEIYNVNILIFDGSIDSKEDIEPATRRVLSEGNTSLLIVCDEIKDSIADILIENYKRKAISISIVKNPYYTLDRYQLLEDIAVFTDGEIYNPRLNTELILGKAEKVTTSFETTLIQRKDKGVNLDTHLKTLEFQKQTDRIANLNSNVAIIYTGGVSTSEVSEKHARVEDAVGAVKCALEQGVVLGGGVSFKYISTKLKSKNIGYNLLLKSITAPMYQILENANITTKDVFGEELEQFKFKKYGKVYNVRTRRLENNSNIIDTVKGLSSALKNAVSVSNIILSTKRVSC